MIHLLKKGTKIDFKMSQLKMLLELSKRIVNTAKRAYPH